MEIDVRWTADAAANADGTVNQKDRFFMVVLHYVLRRASAVPAKVQHVIQNGPKK